MLKVPSPIPPAQLKRIAELCGYSVAVEDEWNWAMTKYGSVPIVVPKDGDFVAIEVMMGVLNDLGLFAPGDYFPLRDKSAKELGLQPN
jgi:hypothetical protein